MNNNSKSFIYCILEIVFQKCFHYKRILLDTTYSLCRERYNKTECAQRIQNKMIVELFAHLEVLVLQTTDKAKLIVSRYSVSVMTCAKSQTSTWQISALTSTIAPCGRGGGGRFFCTNCEKFWICYPLAQYSPL